MNVDQWADAIRQFIDTNYRKEPKREVIAWLKSAKKEGPECWEAAQLVAKEMGLSLTEDEKPPDRSTPVDYNVDEHLLLCDEAHKAYIFRDDEYAEFLNRVAAAGVEIFKVVCPTWPPVKRTPLALRMSTGGGQASGPFDGKPWVGVKWAVEQRRENRNICLRIGREMVPEGRELDHDRAAYASQVPCFNPAIHIPAREWCNDNDVDFPGLLSRADYLVTTVNPYMLEERRRGSFTPTRRCIPRVRLSQFERDFNGGRRSVQPAVPAWPRWDYPDHASDESEVSVGVTESHSPTPEAAPAPTGGTTVPTGPAQPPGDWSFLEEGARAYKDWQVNQAILKRLPNARFFGGRPVDAAVVGITQKALRQFLNRDKTDRMTYVRNIDGKSFDCDDFAVMLRAAMSRMGIHCVGIVGGDRHAWNVVILAGGEEPDLMFIEPMTDAIVTDLSGQYAVEKRCEIFL